MVTEKIYLIRCLGNSWLQFTCNYYSFAQLLLFMLLLISHDTFYFSLPCGMGSSTSTPSLVGWDLIYPLPPLWVGSSTSLHPLWGGIFYFPYLVGWDLLLLLPPLWGGILYIPSLPYGWDLLRPLPPLWVGSSTSPPSLPCKVGFSTSPYLVGWDLLLLPPL